ncbi:MAG: lytic transglycosylase domain-containing protein [Phyllobacteriaceae bacterium]|jgi:soluble lytic murein transglycosylase-like protein|nr:lytic transglycosylase domain-containing protein [Phyllobacteriaceae bacterium]
MKSYLKSAAVLSALYLSLLSTTASAGCSGEKTCSADKINARNAEVISMIKAVAPGQGVPVWFALRIAKVESNYNPKARGSAGELGLYQLKCSTAREMGFAGNCTTLLNPAVNIHYGLKHLAMAIKKSNGNLKLAASKHNGGLSRKKLVASYVAKVF